MKWFVIGAGILLAAWSFRAFRRWHYEYWLDEGA